MQLPHQFERRMEGRRPKMEATVDRAQWVALHLAQLQHYRVPEKLHTQVFDCVAGAGDALALEDLATLDQARQAAPNEPKTDEVVQNDPKADGDRAHRRRVVARETLEAEEVACVVDHSWEFSSAVDALRQLRESPETRERMLELVDAVVAEGGKEDDDGDEGNDRVMKQLHRLAFSIRFGEKSTDMSYYVLNALGSSLLEGKDVNLQVAPVFCVLQQKLFTIAWPVKKIAEGEELVRPYAAKISMMALCKKDYWEARYEGEEEYDWYCQYTHVREVLASYLQKKDRVLVAGSGTSRLPIDMALDGYEDVHAMDFAANVVKKMQERCKANSWPVTFMETDMTNMSGWESSSVDCIIDKGCLDTMLLRPETDAVDNDNWKQVSPDSTDDIEDARNGMFEAARILRPNGYFVFMTFGSPANRIHMFDWVAHCDTSQPPMEWDILQCLEMEPSNKLQGFSSRFYLFVAQKKLQA